MKCSRSSVAKLGQRLERCGRLQALAPRPGRVLSVTRPGQMNECDLVFGYHHNLVLRERAGDDNPGLSEQRMARSDLLAQFVCQRSDQIWRVAKILEVVPELVFINPAHCRTVLEVCPRLRADEHPTLPR